MNLGNVNKNYINEKVTLKIMFHGEFADVSHRRDLAAGGPRHSLERMRKMTEKIMSKHHHQNKAEQVYNKAHGVAPFHYEKMPYLAGKSMKGQDSQRKMVVDDNFMQLRAYQLYPRKEGSPFDN